MIASFLSNISAKYYKNPSMLSRVIAKNVGDVFFETQCSSDNIRTVFDNRILLILYIREYVSV